MPNLTGCFLGICRTFTAMRFSEQVIAAHKNSLVRSPPDRRLMLLERWEQYCADGLPAPVVDAAVELSVQGNRNEVELGFLILMELALRDASLHDRVIELTRHNSATVRRALAYYLSRELPLELICSVLAELLRDKAASVRIKAIETIGMRNWKVMLPDLLALRLREQSEKVIKSLDYWTPLLEAGHRVDQCQESGWFNVTILTRCGIASQLVQTTCHDSSEIDAALEELRAHAKRVHPER